MKKLRFPIRTRWSANIELWIMRLLIIVFVSSSFASKSGTDWALVEEICILEDKVESIQLDYEDLKCDFINLGPRHLAILLNSNQMFQIQKGKDLPLNPKIHINRYVSNTNCSDKVLAALLDYDGPDIVITSLTRGRNKWSDHYKGNAFDIRYNTSFILWLGSMDGQEWIQRHKLDYNIEDNRNTNLLRRWLRTIHAQHLLVNKNASAEHIHMSV